jgi:hypothetical protein
MRKWWGHLVDSPVSVLEVAFALHHILTNSRAMPAGSIAVGGCVCVRERLAQLMLPHEHPLFLGRQK